VNERQHGQNRSIAAALQLTRYLSFAISAREMGYVGTRKFADRHQCRRRSKILRKRSDAVR